MARPSRTDQTGRDLRREIESGRLQGVAVLPGERQLAIMLQVSRTTLRKAIADLVDEGLLSQRHGMGTFVNPPGDGPISGSINVPVVYFGLNGRVDRLVELSRGRSDPTVDESMMFGLRPRADIFRLSRVVIRQERPEAVEHWAAPLTLLPDVSAVGTSLPDAIAARGPRPTQSLQRLRVGCLSGADAAHLGRAAGAPAVCVDEAYFLPGGACCVVNRAYYPADRFDAVFSQSLPGPDSAD